MGGTNSRGTFEDGEAWREVSTITIITWFGMRSEGLSKCYRGIRINKDADLRVDDREDVFV